ncbi:MAG: outer membrane lipoprotein-sorting protein, partial [Paraglaciecola sp.]
ALRRVRRISASDRGDYFLGTDLTYEEIKKEGKYDLSEYNTKLIGQENDNQQLLLKVELTPKTKQLSEELGYSRLITYVDPNIWMSRKIEFWDTNGNALKTIENLHITQIDGYWTVTEIAVKNHKTQHTTRMMFFDIDYKAQIRNDMFTQQQLKRGLR